MTPAMTLENSVFRPAVQSPMNLKHAKRLGNGGNGTDVTTAVTVSFRHALMHARHEGRWSTGLATAERDESDPPKQDCRRCIARRPPFPTAVCVLLGTSDEALAHVIFQ